MSLIEKWKKIGEDRHDQSLRMRFNQDIFISISTVESDLLKAIDEVSDTHMVYRRKSNGKVLRKTGKLTVSKLKQKIGLNDVPAKQCTSEQSHSAEKEVDSRERQTPSIVKEYYPSSETESENDVVPKASTSEQLSSEKKEDSK